MLEISMELDRREIFIFPTRDDFFSQISKIFENILHPWRHFLNIIRHKNSTRTYRDFRRFQEISEETSGKISRSHVACALRLAEADHDGILKYFNIHIRRERGNREIPLA